MKNKKGFSIIELLVSFIIISLLTITMFRTVLMLNDKLFYYHHTSRLTVFQGNIMNSIQKDLFTRGFSYVDSCGSNCYDIYFLDGESKILSIDNNENILQYGLFAEKLPKNSKFSGDVIIEIISFDETKYIYQIKIPISSDIFEMEYNINVVYQTPEQIKYTVNQPKLASGMTPIKWEGGTWIETTTEDSQWYDYNNKKWANAQTEDGSFWVWIPRYIYKITSNWHSSNTGTIAIQFTKGVDDNWNKNTIGYINLAGTADASNNTWTNHPGFTFGDTEISGFWVAKFQASPANGLQGNSGNRIQVLPNVSAWHSLNTKAMYDYSRAMEINSVYGWGTSGEGIDTHMLKNSEWGAIAYLSKSAYGKVTEIWNNSNNSLITGCAASSINAANEPICNQYHTETGWNASTTGNIYGVYDMSGAAWERVMANYNDIGVNSGWTNAAVAAIPNKYIDRYYTAEVDWYSGIGFAYDITNYGDAVYETSNDAARYDGLSLIGNTRGSWFEDHSLLPLTSAPWFLRGRHHSHSDSNGTFAFAPSEGGVMSQHGFRPVVLVDSGL